MKKYKKIFLSLVGAGVGISVVERSFMRKERQRDNVFPIEPLLMPEEVKHVRVPVSDGGEIHIVEYGQGPTLFFLHGVTLSLNMWVYQFKELSANYRVVAMDTRGHGGSIAGTDGYTMERLSQDVLEVMDRMKLENCLVGGHSMGGMILLALATNHLERLAAHAKGLALIGTTAGPLVDPILQDRIASYSMPIAKRLFSWEQRNGFSLIPPGDIGYLIARYSFGRYPSYKEVELVRSLIGVMSPLAAWELFETILYFDVHELLANINIPSLVLSGSKDRMASLHHSKVLAEKIPDAHLIILPQAGHMLPLERYKEFNEELSNFAQNVLV
ncbi:MAG: alpha/beta hydrolase [Actinobacteria bacterium]|nr:alpha/beta hydrolase [Actinomycetota bacterium]MCL6104390.1 alpha/beta hydrolase [Actinomycetota bacterium]